MLCVFERPGCCELLGVEGWPGGRSGSHEPEWGGAAVKNLWGQKQRFGPSSARDSDACGTRAASALKNMPGHQVCSRHCESWQSLDKMMRKRDRFCSRPHFSYISRTYGEEFVQLDLIVYDLYIIIYPTWRIIFSAGVAASSTKPAFAEPCCRGVWQKRVAWFHRTCRQRCVSREEVMVFHGLQIWVDHPHNTHDVPK